MYIPAVNLKLQYLSIKSQIDQAIAEVFDQGQFIGGEKVRAFENEFAKQFDVKHCIAVGNGTDALFTSLKMLGLKSGDEVITPAFSWISTSETISSCGATPIFADIHLESNTLDPEQVRKKITKRTKAVLVVHLFGQAAHVQEIKEICLSNNLMLIEDCAQAHFTEEENQLVGTFGDAAAFSFYPTKNLGAYGDAGCVITNNDLLAEKIKRYANHGALKKDDHLFEGGNSRMDSLQAAILLIKLKYIHQWTATRIQHAQLYNNKLRAIPELGLPVQRTSTKHTYHQYTIRTNRRNELRTFLLQHGIETLIHYPKALPNLVAYTHFSHSAVDFPVANLIQDEILSLPIYPELKTEEIVYVSDKIREFFKAHVAGTVN